MKTLSIIIVAILMSGSFLMALASNKLSRDIRVAGTLDGSRFENYATNFFIGAATGLVIIFCICEYC